MPSAQYKLTKSHISNVTFPVRSEPRSRINAAFSELPTGTHTLSVSRVHPPHHPEAGAWRARTRPQAPAWCLAHRAFLTGWPNQPRITVMLRSTRQDGVSCPYRKLQRSRGKGLNAKYSQLDNHLLCTQFLYPRMSVNPLQSGSHALLSPLGRTIDDFPKCSSE